MILVSKSPDRRCQRLGTHVDTRHGKERVSPHVERHQTYHLLDCEGAPAVSEHKRSVADGHLCPSRETVRLLSESGYPMRPAPAIAEDPLELSPAQKADVRIARDLMRALLETQRGYEETMVSPDVAHDRPERKHLSLRHIGGPALALADIQGPWRRSRIDGVDVHLYAAAHCLHRAWTFSLESTLAQDRCDARLKISPVVAGGIFDHRLPTPL